MIRTLIGELAKHVGETVSISGWVDVRRDQGKMVFFDFRDRSGMVQAICLPNRPEALAEGKMLRSEYVVRVEGIVNKRPEKNIQAGKVNGDIELEIKKIEVLSPAASLPFELTADLNLDTYLDNMPLTLRTPLARGVFNIQATVVSAFRESLHGQGFTEFQAPALVGADAEGGAASFAVDYYYGKKAFLATSPQLYKQIMVGTLERVFATPKVFRGEKHATTRHLSEYTSLDFELGFITDHTEVMAVLEKTIRAMVSAVVTKHANLFTARSIELPLVSKASFPILKLREAQKILGVGQDPDLEPEHERQICEWAKKEHGSDFVFITHYPVSKRPFYTYEDESDPGFTKSFDLLFRGLEITTGGQRIHNYEKLIERAKAKGLDPEKFSFYLQAFKYGMPPHGGSATGLERFTARMLNLPNVKEATLFPRDLNRIDILLHESDTLEN
ncbi:MAG: aspartate--tRNA(Asn) ligase [bacterium]|nr:aspartate--tRNA(Asn) ligase [bacterium]